VFHVPRKAAGIDGDPALVGLTVEARVAVEVSVGVEARVAVELRVAVEVRVAVELSVVEVSAAVGAGAGTSEAPEHPASSRSDTSTPAPVPAGSRWLVLAACSPTSDQVADLADVVPEQLGGLGLVEREPGVVVPAVRGR
jgi:hypothetical protein